MRRYVCFEKREVVRKTRKEAFNALSWIFTLLDEAQTSSFKDIKFKTGAM
jgi:hypothetical protein